VNRSSEQPFLDPHRWTVFGGVASVYFLAYFHRVSTSVVAPDLMAVFQTDATALGIMSSMYFYAYALGQPLVGYLADRLGPRRVIGFWMVLAALGCVLFGIAPSITWAAIGRGLIGFGVGGVYVPALKTFAQWFRPGKFTTMTGLLIAIGNVGAVVATTPLAWTSKTWGWRASFFLIAIITLLLALFVLLFTRDFKPAVNNDTDHNIPAASDVTSPRSSIRLILTSIKFWILVITFFGIYGIFLTLQGLWATPYLMSVLQIDRLHASELNMVLPLGFMMGAPLFGWISDRVSTKKTYMFIGLLGIITLSWLILALWTQTLNARSLVILFFIMGATTGGWVPTLWALAREAAPTEMMGLFSGLLNPAPFFGVALFQILTGAILDRVGRINEIYPPVAFHKAFWVCMLAAAVCLLVSIIFKNQLSSNASSEIN
jgi:sugar phosphate permease